MATRADNELITKWRTDAQFLLDLYTTAKMDERLGFKNNLSGYLTDFEKRPSKEKIELFYQVYGKDLERYDRQVPENVVKVREVPELYGVDLIADLKSIKEELQSIKNMLSNPQDQQDIAELRSRVEKIENRLPPESKQPDK